jgi:hypothetical protein
MAKGEQKSNREKKKPKKEVPKANVATASTFSSPKPAKGGKKG